MCVPYFLTAVFLIGLDSIYLSLNRDLVDSTISKVQNAPLKINYLGLVLCYFILITGLYYFIIRQNKSYLDAFLLGVFVSGIYEMTNYATFQKWKQELVVIDTIWGGILFMLTAFLVKFTVKKMNL